MRKLKLLKIVMAGKKRVKQNRIDTDGQNVLLSSLPNTNKFSMVLDWEDNDYGIDGDIKFFKDENHEGEFLKFQLNSTGSPKYSKEHKYLSFQIDLDSGFFLSKQMKHPTILFVVDTKNRKVFWHPIQLDTDFVVRLDKKVIDSKDTKKSKLTIRLDCTRILDKENYEDVYNYYLESSDKLAKESLIRQRTDRTLSRGLQVASEINESVLSLPGFDWHLRTGSKITPGTIFTASNSQGKFIDYLPNKDFTPDKLPKVSLKTKFDIKDKKDKEKYKEFRKMVEGRSGEVELDQSNIDLFEFISGNKVIDSGFGTGKVALKTSPAKIQNQITLRKKDTDIDLLADTWFKDNTIFIRSLGDQPVSLYIKLNTKANQGTFKVGVNSEVFSSPKQELMMINSIQSLTGDFEVWFRDPMGIRRRFVEANIGKSDLINKARHDFIEALSEIEEITGKKVPYPIPTDLKDKHIEEVFWLHRMLKEGLDNQSINVNFTLQKEAPEPVKRGLAIQFKASPSELYLFGKEFILENYEQTTTGVIQKVIKTGENQYKLKIKDAKIKLNKK